MITIPPPRALTEIRSKLIPDITKIWKVGQVLNATVEGNVSADGKLLMRIGQYFLETRTPVALKAGDQLKLQVKSSEGEPTLKILITDSPPHVAANNLKNYIARQLDLTQLLQLSRNILDNQNIPKILKKQLIELNRALPTAEQATQAKALKKMIQNSGVFLESRLLKQPADQLDTLQQDVKSQLLKISSQLKEIAPELTARQQNAGQGNIQASTEKLVQQLIKGEINPVRFTTMLTNQLSTQQLQILEQAFSTADITRLPAELFSGFMPLLTNVKRNLDAQRMLEKLSSLLKTMGLLQELKTDVEGTLAKITSQQLTTLTRDTDSPLLLLFDLILQDKTENHLFKFRLEQEKKAKDQNDSGWLVALSFNLEELGPVQARLHLTGNNISTIFNAEKQSTVETIVNNINQLDTAFRNIGLDVFNLDAFQGGMAQPRDLPDNVHILDIIV